MNNFLVKYIGYMLPGGRQFTVEGVNVTISPSKMVVDCFEELRDKGTLDPYSDKFKEKLTSLYATLILDYKFEPHFSLEKAKFIMIDTRNDDILISLQDSQIAGVEKITKEMQNKQTELRVALGKDVETLRQMLVTDMMKSKGEVSKDEMFIFKQDALLKTSPEMPMTEQLAIRKDIASAQTRTQNWKSKIAREEVSITTKVSELKVKEEAKIKAVGDEYLNILTELKEKNAKALDAKAQALIARRDAELSFIQDVLDMKIEASDSSAEDILEKKTVAELKELAVEKEIEITKTVKADIIKEIIASEKYAV
jgi:hypothetical protein